jgi:hypothetical protein
MPTNNIIIDIARKGIDYVVGLKLEQNLLTQEDLLLDRLNDSTWSPEKILKRIYSATATDRKADDYMDIANTLEGWLFPQGPLRDEWEKLATAHTHQNLRLWLHFREESPLSALPWELAKTPLGTRLSSVCGLCRWVAPIHANGLETAWPLRILLLAGGLDIDGSLGIQDEMKTIQQALLPFGRSIEVVQLCTPTRKELADTVSDFRPHVLHFAGHGSATTSGEPGLNFEVPPPQGSWLWTGNRILPDLHEWGCVPRFVFLNACRTVGGEAGSRTAQRSFMEAGSSGAIAMQADMPGDLAGVFAATFYQKLVDGLTVSEASRMARRAILTHSNDEDLRINYAIPRVEVAPGLRLLQRPALPEKTGFEFCDEFAQARFFGNCSTERRKATVWFNPLNKLNRETAPQYNPVLLISGEARSGKSHFLKWCMETWALGEARIRYIELHERSLTFLDVLRQIRLGESDLIDDKYQFLHSPLPPGPFKRYRWELENLLTKGVSGEWKQAEGIADLPDERGALPAIGDKRLEPDIAACFREALEAAAEDKPLLLIFDRFSGGGFRRLPTEDFKQLVQHLFKPLAANPTSNVKLVFCATASEIQDFGLTNFPENCRIKLEVPGQLEKGELIRYALEADSFKNQALVKGIAEYLLDAPNNLNLCGMGRLGPLMALLVNQGVTWERMI